jgi:hypothetical protein
LVADIVDPESTIKLMTDALDMYCDQLVASTSEQITISAAIDHQLEAVITTAILETNPHLKDRFYLTFEREPGELYNVNIKVLKSPLQQHLELVTAGSHLCH